MSTVDDGRAAYRRDHRKPSPSDDQPRDSVYSFEDLAWRPRPTRTGTLPDNRPTEDPMGRRGGGPASPPGSYWCSRWLTPETFLARAREASITTTLESWRR